MDCPLDCEFLVEARRHEKPHQPDPETVPHKDVAVRENFLEKHSMLIMTLSRSLVDAALDNASIVDNDIRDALDALTRTYRTRESGLIYEVQPANPYAAAIVQSLKATIEDFERRTREATGMSTIRDADIFGVLVFLQRMELSYNNQRPRGRSFLSFLFQNFPSQPVSNLE